jgi:hypothetical protein
VLKTNASGPAPSEAVLIQLWDHIDRVRLKQSEQHAAIIARRALEAATMEAPQLNQRLRDLAQRSSMPLDRVQALIDTCGGDEAWIESILLGATTTEKAALLSGVAYKAASATDAGAELDDNELTLSRADIDAIAAAVTEALRGGQPAAMVEQKRADPAYPPTGLVDQKKKSVPDDPIAAAFQGDLRSDMIPR